MCRVLCPEAGETCRKRVMIASTDVGISGAGSDVLISAATSRKLIVYANRIIDV